MKFQQEGHPSEVCFSSHSSFQPPCNIMPMFMEASWEDQWMDGGTLPSSIRSSEAVNTFHAYKLAHV